MGQAQYPKRLRVMAEYASSGLWSIEPTGPFRHGMLSHEALDLPEALAQGFREWISQYWLRLDGKPFDTEAFNATGRALAQALKQVVGPEVYVEFVPETPEGELGRRRKWVEAGAGCQRMDNGSTDVGFEMRMTVQRRRLL